MHLLGNGAQRELLTSRLLRRRLNYPDPHDLLLSFKEILQFFLYISCVYQLGREIREPCGNTNKEVGGCDIISKATLIQNSKGDL